MTDTDVDRRWRADPLRVVPLLQDSPWTRPLSLPTHAAGGVCRIETVGCIRDPDRWRSTPARQGVKMLAERLADGSSEDGRGEWFLHERQPAVEPGLEGDRVFDVARHVE